MRATTPLGPVRTTRSAGFEGAGILASIGLYNTVAGEGPAQRTFHGLKGGHMPVLRSVSYARLRTPLRLLALLAVGGRSSAGHSRSHPEPHPIRHSFSRPPERLADLTPLLLQERKE